MYIYFLEAGKAKEKDHKLKLAEFLFKKDKFFCAVQKAESVQKAASRVTFFTPSTLVRR